MKISVDTHTHSIASGHAYSTIDELARGARRRGLYGFVLTEHGPAIQGFPHPYYFGNLKILPEKINGVRLFRGIEANIMDSEGGLDLDSERLKTLDFVMAGLHEACFPPADSETHTRALIAALANPLVDGISHPGNRRYPADYRRVVEAAARYGKAVEINNATFTVRPGSEAHCAEIARLCRQSGAPVTCGSDAHYWRDVGNFRQALAVIKASGLDASQIVNSTPASFLAFITGRRKARESV